VLSNVAGGEQRQQGYPRARPRPFVRGAHRRSRPPVV